MKGAGIIIKKELRRVFGDKKMIFSLFILPAVLVVGIYGLMGVLVKSETDDIMEHVSIVTVVNCTDELKSIINESEFGKNSDIAYITEDEFAGNGESIRQKIYDGAEDLIVYIDPAFESKITAYKNTGDEIPTIKLYYNNTENYSQAAYYSFTDVLSIFRDVQIEKRIGSLEMLNVFMEMDELLVNEDKANGEFLSMMLPYMIVLMLFAGVMSVAVDAIAGEKERGTLASMLLSPVKRSQIVFGKLISLSILAGSSSIVYSVSMIVAMPLMGDQLGEGAAALGGISFHVDQIIMLVVDMLVLVYLFVALVSVLCVIAKDSKTASSLIAPAYIVVIVCGMLTMFGSGKDIEAYKYAIPIYGNALAVKDICSNSLSLVNFGLSLGGTALVAFILTVAVVKAFNSEKLMFNA